MYSGGARSDRMTDADFKFPSVSDTFGEGGIREYTSPPFVALKYYGLRFFVLCCHDDQRAESGQSTGHSRFMLMGKC